MFRNRFRRRFRRRLWGRFRRGFRRRFRRRSRKSSRDGSGEPSAPKYTSVHNFIFVTFIIVRIPSPSLLSLLRDLRLSLFKRRFGEVLGEGSVKGLGEGSEEWFEIMFRRRSRRRPPPTRHRITTLYTTIYL